MLRSAALVAALALALPADPGRGSAGPSPELAAERRAFAEALRAFRGGTEGALERLRASGERMAHLGRDDARDVVAFYAALPVAERAAGLAAEERYERLWDEVRVADRGERGDWPARRDRIVAELEALVAERRAAADPTPAARALSLSARVAEQRAREDAALERPQRDALVARAEREARESLQIFERAGLLTPRLEPLWLLARVADARKRTLEARDGFEDCLALARRAGSAEFTLHALRGLLALAAFEGDVDEQRELLTTMAEEGAAGSEWWLARRWASLLLNEDEPEAATRYLSAHRPARESDLREWHLLFGGILQRVGRFEEAEAHFRAATAADGPVRSAGELCSQLQTRIAEAQAALRAGDPRRALELERVEGEEACAPSLRLNRLYTLGAALLGTGQSTRAAAVLGTALEDGRSLESSLERTSDGSVFGEIVGLEIPALLAQARAEDGDALEAVRVVEEFQARRLRGAGSIDVTGGDVVAWARQAERGLLTWVIGADTTVCAHVGRDGTARAIPVTLKRQALADAVRRVREAAVAGDERRARELAAEIEARIVPAAIRTRVAGTGRLLVLAHGSVERMPLDLLPLAAEGALLVLPGLPGPSPEGALDARELERWSVLGDPSSPDGASVLPGARAEAESVARIVGAKARTGDGFDRLALLEALRSGRPLHVATHLVPACGEETRSVGLLLARGAVLCERELREIGPHLPLAVLAACETAEGRYVDAQALASVANAFVASGTRNLLVTLWPVDDEAARDWSVAFHRALERGVKPSEAAVAAREELRREGTSVSEWAAFRFVGRD